MSDVLAAMPVAVHRMELLCLLGAEKSLEPLGDSVAIGSGVAVGKVGLDPGGLGGADMAEQTVPGLTHSGALAVVAHYPRKDPAAVIDFADSDSEQVVHMVLAAALG